MTAAQYDRQQHLIRLMGKHRLSCPDVAAMLDREPHTVRCWRAGINPITDHTLALLELLLRHGYHERRAA